MADTQIDPPEDAVEAIATALAIYHGDTDGEDKPRWPAYSDLAAFVATAAREAGTILYPRDLKQVGWSDNDLGDLGLWRMDEKSEANRWARGADPTPVYRRTDEGSSE